MQVQKTRITDTSIKLIMVADQELLASVKQEILKKLSKDVKVPGFRAGKVPPEIVEKNVNPATLQNEFLDAALNIMYGQALNSEGIRPVSQPKVEITKFVPFTTLEFEAVVDVIGNIKLPDYTKIKLAKKPVKIMDKDVTEVIDNLRIRMADKQPADRAAKEKDEVWIDFTGVDAKTKDPIKGADGKDYPLVLGSDTFIPGFEKNLLGAKAGDEREFTLEFPKDYGVKALQTRKVAFTVKVTKVNEVVLPKVDDEFAAKVGPFKSVEELKKDIKTQIQSERDYQNDREFESELLTQITEKASISIPSSLIDDEVMRLEQEERQNIAYRGQTWQEHLAEEGVNEEEHRAKNRPDAEKRVKAGLILAEIAEKERIQVSPEAFEMRIKLLKGKYQGDERMQAELDKPENRRELASRMLSEETIARLVGYANAATKK
jgi:trigger factor